MQLPNTICVRNCRRASMQWIHARYLANPQSWLMMASQELADVLNAELRCLKVHELYIGIARVSVGQNSVQADATASRRWYAIRSPERR